MSNPHFGRCPVCCQVEPVTPEGVMDEHDYIETEYEAGYVGGYRQVVVGRDECPGIGRKPNPPRH